MQVCLFSASSSLHFLRRSILNIFFRKFTLNVVPSPNQIKRFGQKSYATWRTTKKHICEKKSNISSETAETVNFHFSHYKSMGTMSCHSNQSSYPTAIKNTTFVELMY